MSRRFLNVLVAIDQTANAVFGGRYDETISGTIGRAYYDRSRRTAPLWAKVARWAVDGLFGQGHCRRTAAYEDAVRASKSLVPSLKSIK